MKATKVISGTLGGTLLLLVVLLTALWLRPPNLLRVGAAYSAKMVCSNVFLAARDPDEVLRADVQAPGVWLLRLMRVSVDRGRGVVRAGLFGFIGDGLAVLRSGEGCTVFPVKPTGDTGRAVPATSSRASPSRSGPGSAGTVADPRPWPDGSEPALSVPLDRLIADDVLAGPGMRAVIVIDHGRLVAERYGTGFDARTPQLGWSMTKTVTAGLIGILVKDGTLSLDQAAGWPPDSDGRDRIRIADLLSMSSGLKFNEEYGALSDVTRMLYLEPNMAAFAHDQPLAHPVGEVWSYSSGSALILSRIIQDAAGKSGTEFARERLFAPLGMASATLETDEYGTFVGSSYMYATPRDWAKFGQFLVQDGVWHGEAMLPQGFVAMMATPVAASRGEYGHGLVWLWGSSATTPGQNPDTEFGIPGDTFWLEGHDGQIIAVVPSRQVVVVRLGLTPAREHYLPQTLVGAVLQTLAALGTEQARR